MALESAADTIVHIIEKEHKRATFFALEHWKKVLNAKKLQEHALRIVEMSKMAVLSRCFTIVWKLNEKRLRSLLHQWRRIANIMKHQEQTSMAIMIQCAWRSCVARYYVKKLALARTIRRQAAAALCIQTNLRGWNDRQRAIQRRRYLLHRHASTCIQRAVRSYNVRIMWYKELRRISATTLQRVCRGHLGRQLAVQRRTAIVEAATITLSLYSGIALHLVTSRQVAAFQIQHMLQHTLFRHCVTKHSRLFYNRTRYVPTIIIQRTWKSFRHFILSQMLTRIQQVLCIFTKTAAVRIQIFFQHVLFLKQLYAVKIIQTILQGVCARRFMFDFQKHLLQALETELQRCRIRIPFDLKHKNLCLSVLRNRTKRILLEQGTIHAHQQAAATIIQRRIRGIQTRVYTILFTTATLLLHKKVPNIVKCHLCRKSRIRVLVRLF